MSQDDVSLAKALERKRAREALRSLTMAEAAARSRAAAGLMGSIPEYREAGIVLVFLSMPGEIDTRSLIEFALDAGKRLAVPRIEYADSGSSDIAFVELEADFASWPRDRFGIPEPSPDSRRLALDDLIRPEALVVVPGLAFDRGMRRLGRGKGYYDRFIKSVRVAGKSVSGFHFCGYGYSVQVTEQVPADDGDELLDLIVTDEEIIRPRAIG
jgi:5-formyltetrahydrofolate cyclo-ligase